MIPKNFISKTKPKGYYQTRLIFNDPEQAWGCVTKLKKELLLKKAESLEVDLSKRKRKEINFLKEDKYLLTINGRKYFLWKKIPK